MSKLTIHFHFSYIDVQFLVGPESKELLTCVHETPVSGYPGLEIQKQAGECGLGVAG